jgi:hypothetical protein
VAGTPNRSTTAAARLFHRPRLTAQSPGVVANSAETPGS